MHGASRSRRARPAPINPRWADELAAGPGGGAPRSAYSGGYGDPAPGGGGYGAGAPAASGGYGAGGPAASGGYGAGAPAASGGAPGSLGAAPSGGAAAGGAGHGIMCQCGMEAELRTSNSAANPGRQYYKCPKQMRVRLCGAPA